MSDNDKPMSVDADESGNSSNSSEEDDEQEKALISRAEELETEINTNKYLYDAHIEVVNLYQKLGDLTSLRAAYQRFHECFPLTPKLWLTWLRDEIKIANTSEEQKKIFDLFDEAVEDYLSIDLWVEYAQFSIGASELQNTRSILERALTAGGLHVSEASLLWDTLRELENAHVSLHSDKSEEWKAQIGRIADVFRRQLSVPLFGMENTYSEYLEWAKSLPEGLVDTKSVEWSYKKALKLLESYKPFEEKLLSAETTELADIYRAYIKLTQKDPSMVICLYERALIDLCLSPDIWNEYCMFLFNLGDLAVKVSGRALRNCPWSEDLWITRIRILEKQGKNESEVLASFEKGLSAILPNIGQELWLAYLEYTCRNNTDVTKIDKLFSQAVQQVGPENDPCAKVSRWYGRLLAKRGDMTSARKIWNGIMAHQHNKFSAILWLEYCNLERQYGEPNQLRTIFKRALATNTDWPQCIAEEWLMFERETGSLEDILKCVEKTTHIVKTQMVQSQSQIVQNQSDNTTREKEIKDHRKKRSRYDEDEQGNKSKKGKFEGNRRKTEEFQPPALRKRIDKNPKTTVFVSNLHSSVDEEKLKEVFRNAALLEIVKDRNGKSRCYGYVQFAKEEEAMTALANDRVPLDGRPVFISELRPERVERQPAFKYATTTENNKLFVKGLPPKKSKEDVREIFKVFNPKDVRLVMKKSGESKGIAYVEFENEDMAQSALKATDQMKIDDDHVITVAISAPPPKKPSNQLTNDPIRHARSRLQMPLIPRSLQVKHIENKTDKFGENGSSKLPPKKNADFRNMLLKYVK